MPFFPSGSVPPLYAELLASYKAAQARRRQQELAKREAQYGGAVKLAVEEITSRARVAAAAGSPNCIACTYRGQLDQYQELLEERLREVGFDIEFRTENGEGQMLARWCFEPELPLAMPNIQEGGSRKKG